jgi:F-type H+-transporting ATPase subunit delta
VTNETIARNYAATLFELARRHDGLESFAEGMALVVGLLEGHPSFKLFLETPRVPEKEKAALLEKVFRGAVPDPLLSFLKVTVRKRRQRLLGLIGEEFQAILDEHLGRVHVVVTVARELDAPILEELGRKLSSLLGKEAIPHVRVKPQILGGIHLKMGDTVFDGTLRRRIRQLRRKLVNAPLPFTSVPAEGEAGAENEITS